MPKKSKAEQEIYKFICEHPGYCTYDISKKMDMSGGKVRYFLQRLEKSGLVEFKFERNNPRIKKLTYPVNAWKLLPKNIKMKLDRIKR